MIENLDPTIVETKSLFIYKLKNGLINFRPLERALNEVLDKYCEEYEGCINLRSYSEIRRK
jgi:hypothetical protein